MSPLSQQSATRYGSGQGLFPALCSAFALEILGVVSAGYNVKKDNGSFILTPPAALDLSPLRIEDIMSVDIIQHDKEPRINAKMVQKYNQLIERMTAMQNGETLTSAQLLPVKAKKQKAPGLGAAQSPMIFHDRADGLHLRDIAQDTHKEATYKICSVNTLPWQRASSLKRRLEQDGGIPYDCIKTEEARRGNYCYVIVKTSDSSTAQKAEQIMKEFNVLDEQASILPKANKLRF